MNDQQYISVGIVTILGIGLLVFVITFFLPKPQTFQSSLDVIASPTSTPTGVSLGDEPDITEWKAYTNEKYSFSIDVPLGWNSEDYSAFFNNGSTLIAFSPTQLPCATCSYVHDGFFSIRIYNKQTEPLLYTTYEQNFKKSENSKEYQRITVDGKPGFIFANTATVTTKEWIYEFSLDKNNGTEKVLDSKIFQRAVSSLRSTKLFPE